MLTMTYFDKLHIAWIRNCGSLGNVITGAPALQYLDGRAVVANKIAAKTASTVTSIVPVLPLLRRLGVGFADMRPPGCRSER